MSLEPSKVKSLQKKARHGFRGYPTATIAFYGPDDRRATKVAVGIVRGQDQDPTELRRWFSDDRDLRFDDATAAEISDFIQACGALTVVVPDKIIGCPHEEGKDYPQGESCPQCPYWVGRNRWTGEVEH